MRNMNLLIKQEEIFVIILCQVALTRSGAAMKNTYFHAQQGLHTLLDFDA